jgi:hypothetical protein
MYSNRALQGIADCESALALDPNLANAHGWIGLGKHFVGRDEETEAHVLEAMRISPRDSYSSGWMLIVGFAKLSLGRDEEAVAWCSRSIEHAPNNSLSHFASPPRWAASAASKTHGKPPAPGSNSIRASQSHGFADP